MGKEERIKQLAIDTLNKYLKKGWLEKANKKNPEFANAVSAIKEKDLFFGVEPSACFGYVSGNATAVGSKTEGGVESTYTISLDFKSETYLFVRKNGPAPISVVKMAQNYFPELSGLKVRHKEEAQHIAETCGKKMCREELNSLNYYIIKENRLNRYRLIEENEFSIPVRSINAEITVNGNKQSIHIGNWYFKNGDDYVDIYIDRIPATTKTMLIIAGVITAIILIILLIILF